MNTKYYIVETTGIALKMEIHSNRVCLFVWTNNQWEKADSEYSGIFTDDISVDEIKEGDEKWNSLGLHK